MDHSQSLPARVRRHSLKTFVVRVSGGLLWVILCFVVYLELPRVEQFFEGFDLGLPIPAFVVLSYSWLAVPLIAIFAGAALALTRTRLASVLVLVFLPLLLLALVGIAVVPPMLKLMDDLS